MRRKRRRRRRRRRGKDAERRRATGKRARDGGRLEGWSLGPGPPRTAHAALRLTPCPSLHRGEYSNIAQK
eukprot:5025211-Pyramimonas_sp.AAC.1